MLGVLGEQQEGVENSFQASRDLRRSRLPQRGIIKGT